MVRVHALTSDSPTTGSADNGNNAKKSVFPLGRRLLPLPDATWAQGTPVDGSSEAGLDREAGTDANSDWTVTDSADDEQTVEDDRNGDTDDEVCELLSSTRLL